MKLRWWSELPVFEGTRLEIGRGPALPVRRSQAGWRNIAFLPDIAAKAALLIFLLTAVAAAGAGETTVSPPPAGPRIQFASLLYDFGRIEAGQILKHEFVFTNAGDQLLLITNVHSSCGCVPAGKWARNIEAGQSGTIPIELYTVNFATGPVAKTVDVSCNDTGQPLVSLQIKGEVWRPIEAIPPAAGFAGLMDALSNLVKVVRIVNHEEKPLILDEPVSNNRVFAAQLKTNQPGQEYELVIRIAQPLGTANAFGKITMKTSSLKMPVLTVDTWAVPQQAVTAMPSRIILPGGPAANKLTRSVAIRGLGTNLLVLSEPALNAKGVDIQLHELQPGRYFTVTLTFPEGFRIANAERIELSIKSNHPQFPVIRVPIEQQLPLPVAAGPTKPASQPTSP
jgi:hypothetical protein